MRNFIGQDGFVWWIGIVEDTNDPLTLGRSKVRCFGYHPAKKTNLVPTEDLPWALTIHPANTPNLYACPRVGDWVFGFFLDSLSAQEPAILGYLPAIPQTAAEYFGATPSLTRNFKSVGDKNDVFWEINKAVFRIDTDNNIRFEADKNIFATANTDFRVKTNNDVYVRAYNKLTLSGSDDKSTVNIDRDGTITIESTKKDVLINALDKISVQGSDGAGLIQISDDSAINIESEKDVTVIADNFIINTTNEMSVQSDNINLIGNTVISVESGEDLSLTAGADLIFADSANSITLDSLLNRIAVLEYRLDHATKEAIPNTSIIAITNI